jgi:phosphate transport system substrate-binding protein
MNRAINKFIIFSIGFILAVQSSRVCAADLSGQLVVSGSDAMELLTNELAKSFMKLHKDVKIIVRGSESGKGISDTRSGNASIGMVSRTLSPEESAEFHNYVIAFEGICLITSAKNPVQDLSESQLKGILLGKIVNWRAVGGEDLPINTLIPYRKSASNKIVAEFLGLNVADLKGTEVSDPETGIKAVARDPKALYYVSTGKAFHEKLSGRQFNILNVSGKKANMVAVSQSRYPLVRALSFITLGEPNPLAKAFISYCMSQSAAHTIRANYYIKPQ